MPAHRRVRNRLRAVVPLSTAPASSASPPYESKGRGGLDGLLAGIWAKRLLAGLREVELCLPDEACVGGLLAADAGRVLDVVGAQAGLDLVDRHDLQRRVAVLVEPVVADHALEGRDLCHRVADLLASGHVAAVRLDGVADRGHQ